MMAFGALALMTALAVPALIAGPQKAVTSGFQVGERTPAFDVVDVSGPNKGKQLCYVCTYGGAPTVMAWINTDPSQAAGLLTQMQKLAAGNQELKTFAVVAAGPEAKPAIDALAAKHHLTIPVTFLPQGKEDPAYAKYKINPAAKTTVLVSRRNKVLANFVNVGPEQYSQIAAAAKKMLADAS
jgi:hypothetical protein